MTDIEERWESDYPVFTTEVTIEGKRIIVSLDDYLELVRRGLVDRNE